MGRLKHGLIASSVYAPAIPLEQGASLCRMKRLRRGRAAHRGSVCLVRKTKGSPFLSTQPQAFGIEGRIRCHNQLRGLLAEFGLVINKGIAAVERRVPEILEDGENCLPGQSRALFARLFGHLRALDHQVKELDAEIRSCHTQNEASAYSIDRERGFHTIVNTGVERLTGHRCFTQVFTMGQGRPSGRRF